MDGDFAGWRAADAKKLRELAKMGDVTIRKRNLKIIHQHA
jgi:hypothetical protein